MHNSRWASLAWQRWKRHLVVKQVGLSAFLTIFFIAYFHLLRHPAFPVSVMPTIWLDQMIPFEPLAVLIYVSLWIYVAFPALLTWSLRQLYLYAGLCFALCVVALVCFYFWPTSVPVADTDWARYPGLAFLKHLDAGGNACPSLHVATAVFTGIWLNRFLRHLGAGKWPRTINALWCVGIIYSTLATRQHVALDALAGAGLGGIFGIATQRLTTRLVSASTDNHVRAN